MYWITTACVRWQDFYVNQFSSLSVRKISKTTKFRAVYLLITMDAAVFWLLLAAFFRASAASGGM